MAFSSNKNHAKPLTNSGFCCIFAGKIYNHKTKTKD